MYAKKSAPLIATVALLFLAGSAFAGSIDFSYTGQDSASTWTWGGGTTTLSATANNIALGSVGGTHSPLTDAVISFTSGPGTGGAGTISSPYTFGPSAADSITVTGCLPGQGSGCSAVTLFVGQFLQGEAAYTGNGDLNFDAIDVSGTVNPLLAAFFGFTSDNVTGSLDGVLVCSGGFYDGCMGGLNGLVGSGDLVLSPGGGGPPTPEPSALFLLGSGLCGLTFYMRRRAKR
ncbi:MAG TPA: PEP-CTERM sorting domain-containing protein [Terriglobia bacterium]|jgi:hypothetical protein|nr:PEP-CTERM sorting domain-containing protein [Terriglobia bacterium]